MSVVTMMAQALIAFYAIQIIRLFTDYISRTVNANETDKMMKLQEKAIMIVFGSGGHTSEMLMMLKPDASKKQQSIFERYGKVYFVIGHSDTWSLRKIKDFLKENMGINIQDEINKKRLEIVKIYRAREVKQSYITSVFTTLYAILHSLLVLAKIQIFNKLDLVVSNGPGTALPICYIHFILSRVLLFNVKAKVLFIESFCRVQDLSLTGKLLRPILKIMGQKFIV